MSDVTKANEWLDFWGKLTPEALKLGRSLYHQFDGDASKALAELRTINDQRVRRARGEADIDKQLDAASAAGWAASAEAAAAAPVSEREPPEHERESPLPDPQRVP